MAIVKCRICKKSFYVRPNHLKRGWGKSCSRACRNQSQLKGSFKECGICGKEVWRSPKDYKRSKSGSFFCSKSCQTIWRNKKYSGDLHKNWIYGKHAYRNIIRRTGLPLECSNCGIKDKRVLVVHHKDQNRNNNRVENLSWLCHNCHVIVHYTLKS